MKFGTRLILSIMAPIVVFLIGFGYLDEQRTRRHYREELRREGRAIARVVQIATQDAIRDDNFRVIQELVEHMTGFERVYGLRLLDLDGKLLYQSAVLEKEPFLAMDAFNEVMKTGKPGETQRSINGRNVLTYIAPLTTPEGTLCGAIQLLQLESFIDEEVRSARNAIIGLTLLMILVTVGLIVLVTRLVVSRPLAEFIARIRTIDPLDSQAQVPVQGGDELKRLAREFNALWSRLGKAHESLLAAELRAKNAERLAALGEMGAGLAHEIGTPLNVIGMRTDMLVRRRSQDPAVEKNLRIISEQLSRITRIVRQMLEFSRAREINPVRVEVNDLVTSVLEFVEPRFGEATRVETSLAKDLPAIAADKDQIYEVFLNLVLNAIDSMASGGTLLIRTDKIVRRSPEVDSASADYVVIHLDDTGEGIPPENLERVFDPFFTTKTVGKGSGLGMSVAYGIVREHGGWIEVDSAVGRGTRIRIHLPVEAGPAVLAGNAGVRAS